MPEKSVRARVQSCVCLAGFPDPKRNFGGGGDAPDPKRNVGAESDDTSHPNEGGVVRSEGLLAWVTTGRTACLQAYSQ